MILVSVLSFYGTVLPVIWAFMPDPDIIDGSAANTTNATCIMVEDASVVTRELFSRPCVALNATLAEVLIGAA
eukprot:SAG22_NODE_7501_length_734_cov_1.083465_1_plen_73_part_00